MGEQVYLASAGLLARNVNDSVLLHTSVGADVADVHQLELMCPSWASLKPGQIMSHFCHDLVLWCITYHGFIVHTAGHCGMCHIYHTAMHV